MMKFSGDIYNDVDNNFNMFRVHNEFMIFMIFPVQCDVAVRRAKVRKQKKN